MTVFKMLVGHDPTTLQSLFHLWISIRKLFSHQGVEYLLVHCINWLVSHTET